MDCRQSEAAEEVKTLWRDGLLTEISRNERCTTTLAERFFRTIKNLTIDGYYTSEIGIQKDLRCQGNAYLKEFKGCTHSEHPAWESTTDP